MKTSILMISFLITKLAFSLNHSLSLGFSNQITNDKDFRIRNGYRICYDLEKDNKIFSFIFNSTFSNKVLTLRKKERYGGEEYQKNVKTWIHNLSLVYASTFFDKKLHSFSNGFGFGLAIFHDNVNIGNPRINLNFQFEYVKREFLSKNISFFSNFGLIAFSPPQGIKDASPSLVSTFILTNYNVGLKYTFSKSYKRNLK